MAIGVRTVSTITKRHLENQIVCVFAMNEWFWHFMCACYFVGGCTIGYYFNAWRNRKHKTGTGRWDYEWDYKDRHLP